MPGPTLESRFLASWLEDGPTTAPSDLLESAFLEIPARHRQRRGLRAAWRYPMLANPARYLAATVAIIVIAVAGFALLGRGGPPVSGPSGIDASPTPTAPSVAPTESVPPTADVAPTERPAATESVPPSPTPVGSGSTAPCDPADLAARITLWDGAAGHRIATVELTNAGPAECGLDTLDRVQLVDGGDAVLIDGEAPPAGDILSLSPDDTVATLVLDGNYCGPTPVAPITVAFVLPGGVGRVVAAPLSPTGVEGVPPCSGPPGSAGTIEMHPWAP
jgi:Domain of unknown function (DUF4232)